MSYYDIMTWKWFQHYWPSLRGSNLSPLDSPHEGSAMRSFDGFVLLAWASCWKTVELLVLWEVMKLMWLHYSDIPLSHKIYTRYNCCVSIAGGVLLLTSGSMCSKNLQYTFVACRLGCIVWIQCHINALAESSSVQYNVTLDHDISSICLYFMIDPVYTYTPVPVN